MTAQATGLVDAKGSSTIKVRPSTDDDVPAMLAIYQEHVTHGIGDLGSFVPSRFDEEDLKRRRKICASIACRTSSPRSTA